MLGKKELCKQLEDLATRLGAKLMFDELAFPGGHCRSKGQYYIIINERLALDEKIRLLCTGISELPWEQETLPAEIQNLLIRKPPKPEQAGPI
jgi:hypothetical protein